MDGRLSKQFQMTRLKAEEEKDNRKVFEIPANGSFRAVARAAAIRHRIPVHMFEKLVTVESNWNPNALSHAGAIGLAQLMPETAPWPPIMLGPVLWRNTVGCRRIKRPKVTCAKSWANKN